MNALELEFLFALDFDLFIRPKDIAHAIRDLLETSGPAAAGWPALADEDLQIAYPVRCEPPARCMPAAASRRRTRIWRARPAAPADSAPAVCRPRAAERAGSTSAPRRGGPPERGAADDAEREERATESQTPPGGQSEAVCTVEAVGVQRGNDGLFRLGDLAGGSRDSEDRVSRPRQQASC